MKNKTGDTFNQKNGQLSNYVQADLRSVLGDRKHYNIRSFHADTVMVPFSQRDYEWWDGFLYQGLSVGELRSIFGQEWHKRVMEQLDEFTTEELDEMTMWEIENYPGDIGNERWPQDDPDVLIGKDPDRNYSTRIQITVPEIETEKIVSSYYRDDIYSEFAEDSYVIELLLRDFPSQNDATHLDLDNSYVDFSTDIEFNDVRSLQFSDTLPSSLPTLIIGGDVFAQWSRSDLSNDPEFLSNINAIRFRLVTKGEENPFIFYCHSFKLVPVQEALNLEIDTKRGVLRKTIEVTPTEAYMDIIETQFIAEGEEE